MKNQKIENELWKIITKIKLNFSTNEIVEIIAEIFLFAFERKKTNDITWLQEKNLNESLKEVMKKYEFTYSKNIAEVQLREILIILKDVDISEYLNYFDIILTKLLSIREQATYMTSRGICEIIANIVEDKNDCTIFDGCSGFGNVMTKLYTKNIGNKYLCQDVNEFANKILKTRFVLSEIENYEIETKSLLDSKSKFSRQSMYDIAVIDWPYGMKYDDDSLKNDKNRYVHGEPSKNSSVLWVMQHVLYSLKENGKAFFIVPESILIKDGNDHKVMKSMIISNLVDTIIALPNGICPATNINLNIVVLDTNKGNNPRIQFIDARKFKVETAVNNQILLKSEDLSKIETAYKEKKSIDGFSKIVDIPALEDKYDCATYIKTESIEIKTPYFENIKLSNNKIEEYIKSGSILSDFANLYRGVNILKSFNDENGEYFVLNPSAISDSGIDYDDYIKNNLENIENVNFIQENDIIISCKGEAIKIVMVDKCTNEKKYVIPTNYIIIRPKNNCNPKFLKEYLNSPIGRYLIINIQKGAFIKMISIRDLENLVVHIPKLDLQEKIIDEYLAREIILNEELEKTIKNINNNRKSMYKKMKIDSYYTIMEE